MNDGASDVYAAIASPVRRELLDALRTRTSAVHELAAEFAISRPAISQHLGVLVAANLVVPERAGRENLYRLNADPLVEVRQWVGHYERFWSRRLDALRDVLADRA
jgi:DNA-binding transcriptional ArsR family regulator